MTDPPGATEGTAGFELRRTPMMRAAGGPLFQVLLLLLAVVFLGTAPFSTQPWANLGGGVVALVLWLPGVFAYVHVDEVGVHRRCYRSGTDLWTDISLIELRLQTFGLQGTRSVIRVHRGRHHHLLTPACGLNRATDTFARRLLAAATARGVAVDARGWEPGFSRRAAEL